MQSKKLHKEIRAVYHPYWDTTQPYRGIDDLSTWYNMIILFQLLPVGGAPGTTGAVQWVNFNGFSQSQTAKQIQTCRERGQLIILSAGGAGAQIAIDSQKRADAFVQSIIEIAEDLGGIDGIDFNNFETVSNAAQRKYMTVAAVALKRKFENFIITAPPAASHWSAAGHDQAAEDRLLLATMYKGDGKTQGLDLLMPQNYDHWSLCTENNARYFTQFYNGEVDVDGETIQIPQNHIAIAFAVDLNGDERRWGIPAAVNAYKNIAEEGNNQRGVVLFSTDRTQEGFDNEFAEAMGRVLPEDTVTPPVQPPTVPPITEPEDEVTISVTIKREEIKKLLA